MAGPTCIYIVNNPREVLNLQKKQQDVNKLGINDENLLDKTCAVDS